MRNRTNEDAERVIRAASKLSIMWPTEYCDGRMDERRLNMNHARVAIERGRLVEVEDGPRYRWWGPNVDDPAETIELVMEICDDESVEIVSIFQIDETTRRTEKRPNDSEREGEAGE